MTQRKLLLSILSIFASAMTAHADPAMSFLDTAKGVKILDSVPSTMGESQVLLRVGSEKTGMHYILGEFDLSRGKRLVALRDPLEPASQLVTDLYEWPVRDSRALLDSVFFNPRGVMFVQDRYSACSLHGSSWSCSGRDAGNYAARRRFLDQTGSSLRVMGYCFIGIGALVAVPGVIVMAATDQTGAGLGLIAAGAVFGLPGALMVHVGREKSYLAEANPPGSGQQTYVRISTAF
jgi:hypothetical protein